MLADSLDKRDAHKMSTRFRGILFTLSLICLLPSAATARQGALPASRRQQLQPLAAIPQLVVMPTDVAAELAADARAGNPPPLRFAAATEVQVTPLTHGTWEQVAGGRVWRLRVMSAGATDLNFGFTTCWLPQGGTLHVYSEEEDYVQGPYEARDNKPHGELWTSVLPGSRAVIELFVPAEAKEQPQLFLSRVNRGYRDMFQRHKGEPGSAKAGSCNIDVVCPIAAPWSNEIRSVARYSVGGIGLCTGSLINDVLGDYKPFFLTANHCTISPANAASVVVYWNFQSPSCGQHGGGSLAQNQSGVIFRAAKYDVDVTLVELEEMPDPAFQVHYAGWDRSGTAPSGAVGIHHPNGDEKSISFASNTLTSVNSCIGTGGNNTHWRVVWNVGVTEPGSSGSGIWNPNNHRLVGTLSGGGSACGTPTLADCYGKFVVAWTNGATSAERLRDWLDPLGAAPSGISGVNARAFPLIRSGSVTLTTESCGPTNGIIDPGETVTISVPLQNVGLSNTVNLIATLLATNGVTSPSAAQSYGALSTNGTTVTRSFSFTSTGACGSIITPALVLQDGTNNLGVVTVSFRMGVLTSVLTQAFDTVSAPSLPAGWTTASTGFLPAWVTRTGSANTPPNSAYGANDDGGDIIEGDSVLTSPAISIATSNSQLSFLHRYDVESGWDGCVLEISINGGAFSDILTAGGIFISGGYNAVLNESVNPLSERNAWSGDSGSFVTTVVNLPASAAGKSIRLRWHLGNDDSVTVDGWYVDTVMISDGVTCCRSLIAPTIIDTRQTNNNIVFSFNTVSGQTYITEYKGTVATNVAWVPLQTNAGDGTKKSVTNSIAPTTNRFFRVKTQ
jgi:hypothetical protein